MDKMLYGIGVSGMLCLLLAYAWHLGQDGLVTSAVIGLLGAINGAILGFSLAQTPKTPEEPLTPTP